MLFLQIYSLWRTLQTKETVLVTLEFSQSFIYLALMISELVPL